jgi:hypothetical protein
VIGAHSLSEDGNWTGIEAGSISQPRTDFMDISTLKVS